ncbi:MAG: YveK family protein [Sphingomonadaceae bacterium]
MESGRYALILWQRKWVVLSTLLLTLAVVGLGSFLMVPVYSASATVRIAHGQGGSASFTELMYADRLTNTYVHLLKSRPFLEQVIQRLSLETTPEDLAASVKVEPLANTELIRVRAESPSGSRAVDVANALAALFVERAQQTLAVQSGNTTKTLEERVNAAEQRLREDRALLDRLSQERQSTPQPDPALLALMQEVNGRLLQEEQSYVALLGEYDRARTEEAARSGNVTVVELAALPQHPIRPRPLLYLALGALLGLAGGVGLALLIARLDNRVQPPTKLRVAAGMPSQGSPPRIQPQGRSAGSVPIPRAGKSAAAE